jgi:phosphohistidine phosphatase
MTLAAIETTLAPGTEIRVERRIYEGPAEIVLGLVRAVGPTPTTVMVVGHNPTLHDLALLLVGRREGLDRFPTGVCATLVSDGPAAELTPGGARLADLWTPRPPEA